MEINKIYLGDTLEILKTFPDESIDCVITSPPYWHLRNYNIEGQIGLEKTFIEYVNKLIIIFDEIKRVLKNTGTCWVNIGDTYSNNKNNIQKSLCAIPDRFKVNMIDNGWICRNEIIWQKPNAIPQSVTDRFTVDYEKVYFFVKDQKYYFEQQFEPFQSSTYERCKHQINKTKSDDIKGAIGQKGAQTFAKHLLNGELKGRNMRSVWSIATRVFHGKHYAVYPEKLIEPMIKAGCPLNGVVLDPFMGSGTTGLVAKKLGRNYVGIELNPEYVQIAEERLNQISINLS